MENDLISRSELIEKIKDFIPWFGKPEKVECANQIIELISHQPAVERPQGEWIDYSNEGYVECPFCGSATNCEDNKDELHYCWNCGADMIKKETK